MRFTIYHLAGLLLCLAPIQFIHAETYDLDASHTAVAFKVQHLGLSWTFGRFNDISGDFIFDPKQPEKSNFNLTIKTNSIDTGITKRDDHLRGPDFFDVKQFPLITFKSTLLTKSDKGYTLTGEFTMHGVKKKISFPLTGGKTAEFPQGTKRIGFTGVLAVNRSDYGMTKLVGPVGDEVQIAVSFEGTVKK